MDHIQGFLDNGTKKTISIILPGYILSDYDNVHELCYMLIKYPFPTKRYGKDILNPKDYINYINKRKINIKIIIKWCFKTQHINVLKWILDNINENEITEIIQMINLYFKIVITKEDIINTLSLNKIND